MGEASRRRIARDTAWLAEAIALGREQRAVEFKPPGPRTDKVLCARVIRAVFAMANTSTGGAVVIGVRDNDGELVPEGLTDLQLDSWRADHTLDSIAPFADPDPQLGVDVVALDGRKYVVISVDEFADVPVICRRPLSVGGNIELREGACYIRPRLKPESAEVSTAAEMRELLDLAIEKILGAYLGTAHRAGAAVVARGPDDAELFATQVKGLVDE